MSRLRPLLPLLLLARRGGAGLAAVGAAGHEHGAGLAAVGADDDLQQEAGGKSIGGRQAMRDALGGAVVMVAGRLQCQGLPRVPLASLLLKLSPAHTATQPTPLDRE